MNRGHNLKSQQYGRQNLHASSPSPSPTLTPQTTESLGELWQVLNYLAELGRNKAKLPSKRSVKARAENSGTDMTADQRDWVFNTYTEMEERRPSKGSLVQRSKAGRTYSWEMKKWRQEREDEIESGWHLRDKTRYARQILTTTARKAKKKTWYGKINIIEKIFKEKSIIWGKDSHYTMMIGIIHQKIWLTV